MTHSIAQTIALVDAIRQIAYDSTLSPIEALGRIRDRLNAHEDREDNGRDDAERGSVETVTILRTSLVLAGIASVLTLLVVTS